MLLPTLVDDADGQIVSQIQDAFELALAPDGHAQHRLAAALADVGAFAVQPRALLVVGDDGLDDPSDDRDNAEQRVLIRCGSPQDDAGVRCFVSPCNEIEPKMHSKYYDKNSIRFE